MTLAYVGPVWRTLIAEVASDVRPRALILQDRIFKIDKPSLLYGFIIVLTEPSRESQHWTGLSTFRSNETFKFPSFDSFKTFAPAAILAALPADPQEKHYRSSGTPWKLKSVCSTFFPCTACSKQLVTETRTAKVDAEIETIENNVENNGKIWKERKCKAPAKSRSGWAKMGKDAKWAPSHSFTNGLEDLFLHCCHVEPVASCSWNMLEHVGTCSKHPKVQPEPQNSGQGKASQDWDCKGLSDFMDRRKQVHSRIKRRLYEQRMDKK